MSRMSSRIRQVIMIILPTLVIMLAAEVVLRITRVAPTGQFDFLLPTTAGGLYPANETIRADWGPIPYLIETNEFGLRGTGVGGARRPGASRLVTLGDSMTDGFFVDNDGTFQHFLQLLLDGAYGDRYEVINAARGGGSIGMEYAILKGIAIPLKPDVVILSFVTNDIADLEKKTRQELDNHELLFHQENLSAFRAAGLWFFSRTAVGEVIFRLYWRLLIRGKSERVTRTTDLGRQSRYAIPGGADFQKNTDIFRKRFASTDGLVLGDTFSESTQRLVDNYLYILEQFITTCQKNDIVPVFVYHPSYSQIYDESTPAIIQDTLRAKCNRLSVPFLDLTEPMRAAGRGRVLHLAPVDYHPNPDGNRVVARALFDFLRAEKIVE